MNPGHHPISLAAELQLGADRITNHILHSDMEWIDIAIEINALRERCMERAPDKVELFDGLYGQRFTRLWEQWRLQGDTSWTWRQTPNPDSPKWQ